MDPMLDGVLDIVDTEVSALHSTEAPKKESVKPETKTETKTETAEEPKTETKTETKTKTEAPEAEDADDAVEDIQDFSRTLPSESETEEADEAEDAPSNTETETKTEVATTPEGDEVTFSPVQPPQFNSPVPHYNANGEIDNMTPQQYERYITERAKHEMRVETWMQDSENKALDAAEKILPEIRTSPAIRQMVENARIAAVLRNESLNSFEAAKLVKEALGLTNVTQKLSLARAEGKAEGAKSAKVSIQRQKAATVETKGSATKKSEAPARDRQLSKRLQMGDDSAFAELFDEWDKAGKL
jgi:hypothetical protein